MPAFSALLGSQVTQNSPQVQAIKAAIDAAKAKDAQKVGKTGIKSPLLDGDTKDDDGAFKYAGAENRGMYLLRCTNYNRRPVVVDQNVQPVVLRFEVRCKPSHGCAVRKISDKIFDAGIGAHLHDICCR